jgi:hypothetical protein
MKLHQLIAMSRDVKTRSEREINSAYQNLQKPTPLTGIARTYQPIDDEGEKLPSEATRVQYTALDQISVYFTAQSRLLDLNLTKDTANQGACADIAVDGVTLATAVPVSTLLFLEKQLKEMAAIVAKLPALDPTEKWSFSENTNTWVTEPTQTHRSKKALKAVEVSPATDKFPAQIREFTEDNVVGYWTTVKSSGAMPAAQIRAINDRLAALVTAVKVAREAANQAEVVERTMGDALLGYVFAPALATS